MISNGLGLVKQPRQQVFGRFFALVIDFVHFHQSSYSKWYFRSLYFYCRCLFISILTLLHYKICNLSIFVRPTTTGILALNCFKIFSSSARLFSLVYYGDWASIMYMMPCVPSYCCFQKTLCLSPPAKSLIMQSLQRR
jgi:hypothetical protein